MKSIAEVLKGFKIPIPPENIIEKQIEDYIFDTKKRRIKVKISFQNKIIFIKTDAYSKREILIKQKEILGIIKQKFPRIPTKTLK
ncbi:MAG: hypothetical protein AAB513_01955 [Patescibacteria group bacterium]